MGIGPVEAVVLLFILSFVALPLWAIVDAARASDRQWAAIGQNRTVWLTLLVVLTVVAFPVGALLSVVYLLTVRPKLATSLPPATG